MRLNNVRFRPTVCGSNLLTSFRQVSEPAPRVMFCTLSNASPSRSVDLRIDFQRNQDLLPRRQPSTLVFPVVLPVKSVSRRCDHGCGHVLDQLRECSRPDERSALSGCRGFRFHPQFCLCCVQVPVVRQVCQLSLQRIPSLSCGCLLCFQNRLKLM